jgi:predicted amidophosphoribosyltransferase
MISRRRNWGRGVPEPHAPAVSGVRRCLNCGAALTGSYCAHCGQAADVHVLSTRELIHEALEGFTHSDSRLWRTLLFFLYVQRSSFP